MAVAHCVSVSGGKDSLATLLLAHYAHGNAVFPVFADTGNEHESVYEYLTYIELALGITIKRLKRDFTPEWNRRIEFLQSDLCRKRRTPEQIAAVRRVFDKGPTGNPYLDLCITKGRFPSRRAQFCTQMLKTEPLMEYQLELRETHDEVWSWQGVRREESHARRNARKFEDLGGGMKIYRPIVEWRADEVILLAKLFGLESNPLYSQGCDRVGCMPCINYGKDDTLNVAKRWPRHIDRIREWERIVASASWRGDASFFPDPDDQAHLNKRGIDNIVRWATTKRGGKVIDPERLQNAPTCSSSYGLCE